MYRTLNIRQNHVKMPDPKQPTIRDSSCYQTNFYPIFGLGLKKTVGFFFFAFSALTLGCRRWALHNSTHGHSVTELYKLCKQGDQDITKCQWPLSLSAAKSTRYIIVSTLKFVIQVSAPIP